MEKENSTGFKTEDVVLKYCREFETKIKKAPSRKEAEKIMREICQSFERECLSEIKQNFLKKYAEELFYHIWGEQLNFKEDNKWHF